MNKHEFLDIPNINCFLVMRSLKSRKLVTEIFTWTWHYYFLKPEGVKFLREYLGLPASVIPNTHKVEKVVKNEGEEEADEEGEKRDERRPRGRGGRGRGSRGGFRGRQENTQEA
jgi:small subunit ribosomal protein S10e